MLTSIWFLLSDFIYFKSANLQVIYIIEVDICMDFDWLLSASIPSQG